jgi:hypothetical protein
MSYQAGDRVRWVSTGDDGLPLVRYGYIGSTGAGNGRVVMMLDGELKGNLLVHMDDIALVSITNVELRLTGCDLLDDPAMRQGLVHLWSAEADQAGLDVGSVRYVSSESSTFTSVPLGGAVPLAEVDSGGQQYLLAARAIRPVDTISVRADRF